MSRKGSHKTKPERETGAPAVTDEELIARVSHGEATAFDALVDRHWNLALQVAQEYRGPYHDAEDLVQKAFFRAYLRAHQYNLEAASFKTWFFTILKNLCIDIGRRTMSLIFVELP